MMTELKYITLSSVCNNSLLQAYAVHKCAIA